ncbi:hypothetical protein [Bradyrhizobium sp. STM 3557]|uniref:hypothetical protein n=1 Tax=Bradyrhizobium sp. STM 3557 TaxID=578920 RepID=UPI00388FD5DB
MSLDVFDSTIRNSDAEVAANAAHDLPAGFGEAFAASWNSIREWHNFGAFYTARANVYNDWREDIRQKTGETLPVLGAQPGEEESLAGMAPVTLDEVNARLAKIKETYPGLDYITPLTDRDLDSMTYVRMAKARGDAAAMAAREKTWGGTFGSASGTVLGGLTDPVTIATLPLGGVGEAGIALRALEFGVIAAGSEGIDAAANYKSHEAAVPGSSAEIPGEIISAGLFGAGLGGAFGLLGKALGAGRRVLPTALRDDVNAATSEAQLNASNVFTGAAAESANRDAVTDAVRSVANGEPVTSGASFDAAHVASLATDGGAKEAVR